MKALVHILSSAFRLIVVLLICSSAIFDAAPVNAQSKTRTRLKAYYEKSANNDRKISIVLTQGSGRNLAFVENAEIGISTFEYDNEINLTSLTTDENGEAFLYIESDYPFHTDLDGYSAIKANFDGNDTLRSANKLVKFKDLHIDISFHAEDTLKIVKVFSFKFDSLGERVPVSELDLNIGVERLYSTLFLEKIETDAEGGAKMYFPNDIPGDSIGTINVVVKVDDDDDFGTVIQSSQINWGTIVDYNNVKNGRSLFGDEAPMWMIISVFLILLGAWYHFIRAIIKLNRMRKLGLEN